ncbi:MAG: type I-C CRISPR-associated endonuclease Cas1 [Clostridia bacterium]|nr:type I-C CRISPR-associated endonuclease Cas1 [Clostridia bacterium]
MKKLLNTLYVMTDNAYISLDGETAVISVEKKTLGKIPLHTIDGITTFSYVGVSPALMGKCAEYNKPIVFLSPQGKFLARSIGKQYGNILLRKVQFTLEEQKRFQIAKNMISAKIYNCSSVLRRASSDYPERLNGDLLRSIENDMKEGARSVFFLKTPDSLRGLEGECASKYFSVFDQLILQQKEEFVFTGRNRRPPTDYVNALLSFGYALLTSMCVSALESVGLDPYLGFFHTDRAGRCSLALDLEEEFRAYLVDRFVLSIINRKMITANSFMKKENGSVLLTENGRKIFLRTWQERKKEVIIHPFLKEKVEIGLLPYVQALLLARFLRGDMDDYPPFLWK